MPDRRRVLLAGVLAVLGWAPGTGAVKGKVGTWAATILNMTGLQSLWRLGESGPGQATDSKGAHHGTYQGGSAIANAGVALVSASALAPSVTTSPGPGTGINYYLSPTGSDSNDGKSTAAPFATLNKFLTVCAPGDTLYCRGNAGSHVGALNKQRQVSVSGTLGHPITITTYPGDPMAVFDGQAGGASTVYWLQAFGQFSYWTIAGIKLSNFCMIQNGIITLSSVTGSIHDWLITNCDITQLGPGDATAQIIYLGEQVLNTEVSYNVFHGPYPTTPVTGAGVGTDDSPNAPPSAQGLNVHHNVFINCHKGIQLYGDTGSNGVTGTFTHNTFIACGRNYDLQYYNSVTIRDNAGNDPTESGYAATPIADSGLGTVVKDHNFWTQSFNSDYTLVAGSTGLNAASDGTDAGAIQSTSNSPVAGVATVSVTAWSAPSSGGSTTYLSTILADGATVVFEMDESSGNLIDSVASKVATPTGSPSYGNSGAITGHTAIKIVTHLSDYFTTPDHADLDLGADNFSLEIWAARNTDSGTFELWFAKGSGAYWMGVDDTDNPALGKKGFGVIAQGSGAAIPTDGTWHHYVWTRKSGASTVGDNILYVDGVSKTVINETYGGSAILGDNANSLYIGREQSGDPSSNNTLLAYLAIYKGVVLTSTQVSNHYNARTLG